MAEGLRAMRFMVTGSREWLHSATVYDAMLATAGKDDTLVVGDCPSGADWIATLFWGNYAGPDKVERFEANWNTYGSQAGPVRNREMVNTRPDIVLAFLLPCTKPYCDRARPHGSHGTTNAIRIAQHAGIPVTIYQHPGRERARA